MFEELRKPLKTQLRFRLVKVLMLMTCNQNQLNKEGLHEEFLLLNLLFQPEASFEAGRLVTLKD